MLGEQAHYHLMLTAGYMEQQRKRYTLTRLDVGHEKSLDCGMDSPTVTLLSAVTLWAVVHLK